MNVTKIPGIRIRHLQVTDLPSLQGFRYPEIRAAEKTFSPTGAKYELYEDFSVLGDAVGHAIAEAAELKIDPAESYAVAVNKSGEVVGFAYTGGTMLSTVIEGRRRDIPDIHYAYVHPDYRGREIGTAMCEKLMQHHTFLRVSGVSYLGDALAGKLLRNYGHPEEPHIIRTPKRKYPL